MDDRRYFSASEARSYLSLLIIPFLGLIPLLTIPENHFWEHIPFHSFIETLGAAVAMGTSAIILLFADNKKLSKIPIGVPLGLIGMGILDGYHSAVYIEDGFVWLHSLATFVGGVFFVTAVFKQELMNALRTRFAIAVMIVLFLGIGLFSISSPALLPEMVEAGQFTLSAKILNLAGGLGFMLASVKLNAMYHVEKHNSLRFFALFSMLFGISGIVFEASVIWDITWWWWHLLRLAAYFVALVFVFNYMRDAAIELSLKKQQLEDIVERKTHDLIIAKEQAEFLNKEKSRFLANMSHELRTPMHAVLNFASLAIKKKCSDESRHIQYLQNIRTSAIRLTGLLNDLLDLAKLEAGKMEAEFHEQDLTTLIMQAVNETSSLHSAKNINIEFDDETHVELMLDQKMIIQVLINILANAIRFSPDHSQINIAIIPPQASTEPASPMFDQKIHLVISDQGIGIPEAEIDSVFDKFIQSAKTRSQSGGTGLGLSICKEIVEIHSGSIWAESPPAGQDRGTAIHLQLPVYQCLDEAINPATIDEAIKHHEDWLGEIKQVVGNRTQHNLSVSEVADMHRCQLGQWIDSLEVDCEKTRRLKTAHHDFHQIAAETITFYDMGNLKLADKKLNELQLVSEVVIGFLNDLNSSK